MRPRVVDGLADGGVARLRVEGQVIGIAGGIASAEVNLDEVEAQLLEEHVAVLLVVTVESHTDGDSVFVVPRAAGVGPSVAIDAGLQSEAVDMVGHGLQPSGKAGGVGEQAAGLGIAPAEVPVVDVHIAVARILQSLADHGICLTHDERVADVHMIGVPRTPAHERR